MAGSTMKSPSTREFQTRSSLRRKMNYLDFKTLEDKRTKDTAKHKTKQNKQANKTLLLITMRNWGS
jgi:hypothetical protein